MTGSWLPWTPLGNADAEMELKVRSTWAPDVKSANKLSRLHTSEILSAELETKTGHSTYQLEHPSHLSWQ